VPKQGCGFQVLQWTRDWGTAQRLAFELGENLAKEFATLDSPLPGVLEWLLALRSVRVPCALVSALDRSTPPPHPNPPVQRPSSPHELAPCTRVYVHVSLSAPLGRPQPSCSCRCVQLWAGVLRGGQAAPLL